MTSSDSSQVQSFLSSLTPGDLPEKIFDEVARLTVTPVLEVVPFYCDAPGSIQVLLLRKPKNDSFWPGQLHVPGAIILATDRKKNFEEAAQRVFKKMRRIKVSRLRIIKPILCSSARGTELAVLSYVEITAAPPGGNLYDVNELPKNLIEGHKDFITTAAEARENFGSV